jgi:hypothetical protein
VYFTDDSFTVALLRQRERKRGSVCVRVIAVALLGIICTRGHITERFFWNAGDKLGRASQIVQTREGRGKYTRKYRVLIRRVG